MRQFFLGCAVWAYKDWVGDFFPLGSRSSDFLHLYSERLTTVEGNTTFYSVPGKNMVQRWATETPPDFQFCLKLPKTISHQGAIAPHVTNAIAFLEHMDLLGSRLGPLMLQLPPSYGVQYLEDLRNFLKGWGDRHPLAVEVRHLDWFSKAAQALNEMLREFQVGRIVLDTRPIYNCPEDPQIASERRKPQVPLAADVTAPFTIVRYISHPTLSMNQGYLDEWVHQVSQWLKQGTRIYFFVHCPQEVHSPAIARHFQACLEAQSIAVPPLPWNQIQQPDTQLSLF